MRDADILNMSARALVARYRAGDLSPVTVTETMLARIEAVDPKINAFHLVQPDAALAAEARWRKGDPAGLLDGVPTAVKDGLMLEGVPVYRGSAANGADRTGPAAFDAPVVARLREHGAVILGKTTMCDYGMLASGYSSKFGPTRNPWNTALTSGGSSSGSAAAVAAGIAPVIVGTDIVGSVRNPASFCGLVGHKPSFGRVPCYPQQSPAVCAGPIARDVEDAALLLNVLAQPDARDPAALAYDGTDYTAALERPLTGLKVGVLHGLGFGPPLADAVRDRFDAAVAVFARAGAEIDLLAAPFASDDHAAVERFYQVRALAELDLLAPEIQAKATVVKTWTDPARAWSATAHYRDFLATQAMRATLYALCRPYDIVLLPTVPVPPYGAENPGLDNGDIFAPWSNTYPFNLTEQPACSVPCGWTDAGAPVGLQIVGRRYDDAGVLATARAYEIAAGYTPRPVPALAD